MDLIVVGDHEWDEALLVEALLHAHAGTAVLPFGGAVQMLEGGANWWSSARLMRDAVEAHAGLRVAKLISQAIRTQIPWPFLDTLDTTSGGPKAVDLDEESCLRLHGYRWDSDDPTRRACLAAGVEGCGLRNVVVTLRWLIAANKRRLASTDALRTWEDDYAWLREAHPGTDTKWPD